MAQSKKAQITLSIPTIDDVTATVDKLREDVEDMGRRAADLLPEAGRKRLDDLLDDVSKRVDGVRGGVEDAIGDIRGTVDDRVAVIRKDVAARRKKTVTTLERETRKQVEKLFKRIQLPVRSDLDTVKRRLTSLERKLDQLVKEHQEAA